MPSFITKIGKLFRKQETYKPSQSKKTGAKKSKSQPKQEPKQGDAPRRRKPQAQKNRPQQQKQRAPKKPAKPWDPASFQVEPEEGKTRFHDLDLPQEIMHAIADLNFKYCTPIQAEILPLTMAGKDMAGKAQTGTGKTAAFLLGIFTEFLRNPKGKPKPGCPRALILAPTRELAMQIRDDAEKLSKYTPFKTVAVYGGIDYDKQRRLFDAPVDIVVATPGRLIDFAQQNVLNLRGVKTLIIDEADRMLDMGFIPDVRRIVYKTPPKEKRQTLLFSATLDDEVMRLAAAWMTDPGRIEIEPDHAATDLVEQRVYLVTDDQKFALLYNILTKEASDSSAIIFTNRRDQTERLADALYRHGIDCEILSGAVNQNRRQRILADFKSGKCKLVVATDVAGRGIHVDDITHVVNFNIPERPDDYVHRIGRTGRAGKKGISVTFACEKESFELPAIEELLGERLSCIQPEEGMLELPEPVRKPRPRKPAGPGGRSGGNRGPRRRSGGDGSRPPRRNSGPKK
ncbi:DEAD/DEAH box helicase [Tichowtungia aerotolerans]|uniref:DEAD/DEAH box helicase n=1 Tax=Tichowtungia aerotolerans TaxID=2697043 RepID=A0A6P1M9J2_9BACT|nr:DEAD/DEAH box helicase [Tichowtungia aerotolerans]QHI69234.1 DEAD/DEAH box helicase [Tichowtungia aerotolerans]